MQVQSFAMPVSAIRQTVSADLPLPAVVDQLAEVQTAIAVLEALEANLKAKLVESGQKEVCGMTVRATISHIDAGYRVEWKKVAEYLKPSAEVIDLFKVKTEAQDRVTVRGYN